LLLFFGWKNQRDPLALTSGTRKPIHPALVVLKHEILPGKTTVFSRQKTPVFYFSKIPGTRTSWEMMGASQKSSWKSMMAMMALEGVHVVETVETLRL